MQARGLANDLDGVLVGAHGAIGPQAVEHGPEGVGVFGVEAGVHLQGVVGHVVRDAHRDMVFGRGGGQVVEHRLHHGGGEFLGRQPVAAPHHTGPRAGPVLRHGGHHIQIEGLAAAARFLAAIQHGDGLGAGWQGGHQLLARQGAKQPHAQQSHPLPPRQERLHRFAGGTAAGSHQHQHPFGGGVALVVEQGVMAPRERSKAVHGLLHQQRCGVVEAVGCLAGLKANIRVLAGAADLRVIGREPAGPVGSDQLSGHQALEGGVIDQLHRLDFVGGAEAVEHVQERHPARQGDGGGDGGEVAGLLHRGGEQQAAARAAGGHHIAVVAEDREARGGQGPGRHVDHCGGEFPGDLVEVRDHQQQSLRGREGGGEGAGLQGSMHHPGGAGLALHRHHRRHAAPEVGAPLSSPGIGPFAHGGGGGDRVDRHHFVQAIGHPRHGFVAVDPGSRGAHGSSTARAMPTCTSSWSPSWASGTQARLTWRSTPPKLTSPERHRGSGCSLMLTSSPGTARHMARQLRGCSGYTQGSWGRQVWRSGPSARPISWPMARAPSLQGSCWGQRGSMPRCFNAVVLSSSSSWF